MPEMFVGILLFGSGILTLVLIYGAYEAVKAESNARRTFIGWMHPKVDNVVKYRKRPPEIEAIRWNGHNAREVDDFAGEKIIFFVSYASLLISVRTLTRIEMSCKIKTPKGDILVPRGDYIIKSAKGKFYPCKANIFEKAYKRVEDM